MSSLSKIHIKVALLIFLFFCFNSCIAHNPITQQWIPTNVQINQEKFVLRNLFSIFYALFFASMLSSSWGLALFQWGKLFLQKEFFLKVLLRLAVSLFLFNFLPIFLFALIFINFPSNMEQTSKFSFFFRVACSSVLGISVFGFYRIYHFLLSFPRGKEIFYSPLELTNDVDLIDRINRIGPPLGQFIAIFFYFGLPLLSWFYLRLLK